MKKTILILLFINSSLNADYLLTLKNNRRSITYCMNNFYFSDTKFYYNNSFYTRRNYYDYVFLNQWDVSYKSGYYYERGKCMLNNKKLSEFKIKSSKKLNMSNLSILGLTNEDLNLMFALSGIIISSLFLFGLFRFI